MSHRTAAIVLRWWPFAVVAATWLVVATQQIGLPGVYMDAVNPDYLVVRLLNRHAQTITTWLPGGNYLFARAPVLIQLYHGSQQVWLGLPFFALFGTTVTGLRLTHAMFALGILAALYAMLTRGGVKPWQAALAGVALAVDPAFSYAFRTQSYITLAPTAWLFLALYALQRAFVTGALRRRWLVTSGVFYGLAIVGYFIYAFYLPAMLLALWLWGRNEQAGPSERWLRAWLPCWLGGLALGGIFYPIGYGLMIWDAGGVSEGWSQFQQTQQVLGAFNGQIPFTERIAHVSTMVGTVFQNWFHHMLIFGEYAPLPGSTLKTWVLLAVPAALWLLAEARGRSSTLLRILIALPISFAAFAMIFGTRLQGHHFVPLLPLAYAALAFALCETAPGPPQRNRWAEGVVALGFAALIAVNITGQLRESERLAQTRGVGLYSDAINRLGADLSAINPKPFVYFPDWGLWMPVAFLTRGTVGMDTAANLPAVRRMLCDGRDVAFAVINGDRADRIETWRRELRWSEPANFAYRQGDGRIVFELATFKWQRGAPACAAP
jgi:hypothetical protein